MDDIQSRMYFFCQMYHLFHSTDSAGSPPTRPGSMAVKTALSPEYVTVGRVSILLNL